MSQPKYEWTPALLTELRHAWHARPKGQLASAFDREFARGIAGGPRTVQRARTEKLNLKSNPGRVTR